MDDTLKIIAEEKASAGYSWVVNYALQGDIYEVISEVQIPAEDSIPGKSGTKEITLKAKKEGIAHFVMAEVIVWEFSGFDENT